MKALAFSALFAALAAGALPGMAQSPPAGVETIFNDPRIDAARRFSDSDHDRLVRETIDLTEIPAPPFKERERALAFMRMLQEHGLADVEMDAEGNVMGIRRGSGNGPLIAIAAHLDTVFPEGTDVTVRRDGTRLMAPGVGDNARGLAVLLAVIRAMDHGRVETSGDILFVGNVGEEGPGDLRGMRYLFQQGRYKDRIHQFVSLDGTGGNGDIVTRALGSTRFRVTYHGPGGHSWGSFGLVNPAYALANAIARLSRMQVPINPRTTFNIGTVGGGTSVNSIPHEAWMEVDLRSESPDQLDRLIREFLGHIQEASDEENRTRSTTQGVIRLEAAMIGNRPSGQTPFNSAIVETASAVLRRFGIQPFYSIGSTDANIPISMNIPAITIDSGASGGRSHALDEWIDVEKTASVRGVHIVMTTLVALAGLE